MAKEKKTYALVQKPTTCKEARNLARLRATHAAPLWGLSPDRLGRLCNAGKIPEATFDGVWFVTPEGMDMYTKSLAINPQNKTRGGSRGNDDRRGKR